MTNEIVKGIARNELAKAPIRINAPEVSTTDATPTVLISIEAGIFERGVIEYVVNGIKDDGSTGISISKVFPYKTDDTTLTVYAENILASQSDFTTAAVSADDNGMIIEIKVTGEASTNITWTGSYQQTKMNVEVAL